jgi:hypothetical protein
MTLSYKRIDQFKDYLQEIQGKGDLYLDKNFIHIIQTELYGQEITDLKIKKIMKKYGALCYYEYIPMFLKHFNQPVIYFTLDEEKRLCLLFEYVSNKFSTLFPGKSFFNYNYITYKLVEYIKHPDLHLIDIKNKEKIKYYDALWKQICDDLEWFLNDE